jgi:hypothetical protein
LRQSLAQKWLLYRISNVYSFTSLCEKESRHYHYLERPIAPDINGETSRTCLNVDGGNATIIGDGGHLAVDDEFLYVLNYWGLSNRRSLSKMRKNSRIVATVPISHGGCGLIVDKSSLYWIGEYSGLWTKTPK